MEVKKFQIATLWNNEQGLVMGTTENSAHIKLNSGKHVHVPFDQITAAVDTYTEKEAQFLAAKDKLAAYKHVADLPIKKKKVGNETIVYLNQGKQLLPIGRYETVQNISGVGTQYKVYSEFSGFINEAMGADEATKLIIDKFNSEKETNPDLAFLNKTASTTLPILAQPVTKESVEAWAKAMAEADMAFHIEDDPADIVNIKTNEPVFTPEQVEQLNNYTYEIREAGLSDVVFDIFIADANKMLDKQSTKKTANYGTCPDCGAAMTDIEVGEHCPKCKNTFRKHESIVALAPGHVDEGIWNKAKDAVKDSSGKAISDFTDKEWATVNTVYQNMGGKFKSKEAAKDKPKFNFGDYVQTKFGWAFIVDKIHDDRNKRSLPEEQRKIYYYDAGGQGAPEDDLTLVTDQKLLEDKKKWDEFMRGSKKESSAVITILNKKTANVRQPHKNNYADMRGYLDNLSDYFIDVCMKAYKAGGNKAVAECLMKDSGSDLAEWTVEDIVEFLGKDHRFSERKGEVLIDKKTKTAALPADEGAPKYPVGTILTTEDNPQEPECHFIHVLKYDAKEEVYTLNKRPMNTVEPEKDDQLQGVRFEMSKKELEGDKELRVFSGLDLTAGKPSDLVAVAKHGDNICLSFKEYFVVYTPEGGFVATSAKDMQFTEPYRKEFGLMVKNVGFDKLALTVAQRRIAVKLQALAATNDEVINLFVSDSFPKDKMPEWGTPNLKIVKQPNGGWSLVNYATPLAYRNEAGDMYINENKYSNTTTIIQKKLWKALAEAGIAVDTMIDADNINMKGTEEKEAGVGLITEKAKQRIAAKLKALAGTIDEDVADALMNDSEFLTTGFGKKTREGVMAMLTNDSYSIEEIAQAIMNGKDKIKTGWGDKTLEGITRMIERVRNGEADIAPAATASLSTAATVKIASLRKKAARLGNYDFDIHGGKNWKLEAGDDGKPKLKRVGE